MKSLFRSTLTAALLLGSALANAGAITDVGENKIVDALFRGQALAAPATWYVGAGTDVCADAGNGAEPSGNGYARVAVSASLAAWAGTQGAGTAVASSGISGLTSNNATITFPVSTGAWGTIQSVRWYDASTGGNAWVCANLGQPFQVDRAGVTVYFSAGQLTVRVDD
ncbi:phage tail fiber protein [Rhodocyclus tenuis]|uniref:Uncharacterized protein n=1 Tax=Rhodocyclus tenuis TaxID=1066 RepID=A0A840GBW2_RHOTE|nr:hypothetical protein [Rhodocyclus tenuis]MBB4248370.1 hypothetical protein [Rhodocyclus tenuis]